LQAGGKRFFRRTQQVNSKGRREAKFGRVLEHINEDWVRGGGKWGKKKRQLNFQGKKGRGDEELAGGAMLSFGHQSEQYENNLGKSVVKHAGGKEKPKKRGRVVGWENRKFSPKKKGKLQ